MSVGTYQRPRTSRRRPRRWTPGGVPYALLGPSLVLMALLLGYPLIRLVLISFQKFGREQFFTRQTVWNGLANYRAILTDDQFIAVAARTLVVTGAMVTGTMVIGTLVALLMERIGRLMRTVVAIGLLFAWATPPVSATQVWKWMFNSQYGVATWFLGLFGVDLRGSNSVLFSPVKVLIVVTVIVIWQAVPFVALTLYAGLTQVPRELSEAARMDGASFRQLFTQVTFPRMRPVFLLLTTLSVIWDSRVFNQVWVFNRGGPDNQTFLLGSYSYFASFVQFDFGQGAAVAVIMVLLLFLVTIYYVRQMVRAGEAA